MNQYRKENRLYDDPEFYPVNTHLQKDFRWPSTCRIFLENLSFFIFQNLEGRRRG